MALATTGLTLDQDMKERVRRLADARRSTSDSVMREAIAQYLDREEERDLLNRDTLAAWIEYERTGQHLTDEEVDAWLARLEAGEDVDPPPCHG
ncbi:CopG family ribbon-helix-helix protein [Enterovirga rhinocerotis]|uniref:Putative transcriptional regulator n=1 Tax=Enterovirga rhinocerotis TaxID=1339210 RepID=A0A4R7BWC9_9HYPH|nr:ribbon-helix-helix protein, CopG family [Enterovirga rhinocerotis]TDR88256.1 putative transcriptional regulator [Enterovirga rhinocerotis]